MAQSPSHPFPVPGIVSTQILRRRESQQRRTDGDSPRKVALLAFVLMAAATIACGERADAVADDAARDSAVVVSTATVVEQPVTRFIRVSGTLAAQEDAEVAAEVAGRIVATPIERGSRIAAGATLVQIADAEVAAQAREAEANAAQIEARLGTASGAAFEVERVPEVANAQASYLLARTEFERTQMLQQRQLISASEFDQKQAQVEAARRQYEVARNGAEQQYQALMAARARVAMARKAVADTVVRAPFDGVVGERLVSVGDYVTRGTKVASVLRVSPLRLELTVPAQYVSAVTVGRLVSLEVDAYPGDTFSGNVRYVSPALRSDSRALVVEAMVENADGRLRPGLFATARIEQAAKSVALLVPAAAVQRTATGHRVFVVQGDTVEERLVTLGEPQGTQIELTSGVAAGDRVVAADLERVKDGAIVKAGS
jgi:RND family efflux transporter MFP subunit